MCPTPANLIVKPLRDQLTTIIHKAQQRSDIIVVLGDLQDTPDNSKLFHHDSCHIAKYPLGIVKTCENADLLCSIYQHAENMEKPIVLQHGTKGRRFINGTYTCMQDMEKTTGITIIKDTGINSDHGLVITKLDLGIEQFYVSNEQEEQINFKSIMNIPMMLTIPPLMKLCTKELIFRYMQICTHDYNKS